MHHFKSRRIHLLPALLLGAVLLFAGSMPLPWHHRMPAVGAPIVVHGIEGANWLLGVVLIALIVLARLLLDRAGFYTKWLMTLTSLLLLIGMFSDYIDWQSRAAQRQGPVFLPAYFGPGFFLALGGTVLFVAGNVLIWRAD